MSIAVAEPVPNTTATRRGDGGVLYDEAECPLAILMGLLAALGDPSVPSNGAVALAAGLRVRPDARRLDSIRCWGAGLDAVLAANRGFDLLSQPNGRRLAAVAFVPIEPVLRAWRADLALEPGNRVGAAWLDRLGWRGLLLRARRRDQAALQVIAGRAELVDGDVLAIPQMGRHAG